jgi:amino acid adenylation domain-containing protein
MLPDATWTTGRPNIAPGGGLHQAVSRTAAQWPDATALVAGGRQIAGSAGGRQIAGSASGRQIAGSAGGRSISYADLDRTANAWAALLATAGVTRGDLVPVRLPRGPDLVIALLAVLKTGAAYALLDPCWPRDHVHEVVEALSARLLIAAEETESTVAVWTPPAHPVAPPCGFRPAEVEDTDPCCVFFTSGTTGRPKGVLTPHRATARLFQANSFASFGPGTVMPLAAPAPWDAFSLELWSVLLNGGTSLVIDEPYLSAGALRAGVAEHGVDTVWLTSSLFNMIVDEDLWAFAGLRQVLIGGERLSPRHAGRFLRAHTGVVLLNGYGPVESVVFATTHPINDADTAAPGGIPLGRPVPGTGVHVLDGDRPCALGQTGEICVSGDGLALRYLGDGELTAAKFTVVTIGGRATRVYRTGDLGAWGEDGLLRFHGRADRQVKIRGHRIEPGEVERQIERLPAVRQCRVLARRDSSGAAVDLVAFCVPARPGDPLDTVLDTLASTMVAYQLPAALLRVEEFPLTAQGKLDERRLLAMLAPLPAHGRHRHADPTVALVAATFAEVLDRPSVPAGVSFFELGGSSLGAGRVCARLAARLARPLPLSRLYQNPTAAALAAWLDCATPTHGTDDQPVDTAEVALTPMQLVYLTRHLVDPADRTAHCLLFWTVEPDLDQTALQAAIDEVHWRHEALSAAYVADPRPAAWLSDVPPPLLEQLPAQPDLDAGIRVLRAGLSEQLDPTKGEVWRTMLVKAGGPTLFGCLVHHIAFDGFSESVLARDLAAAYEGRLAGLPQPPTLAQMRDRLALRHAAGTTTDTAHLDQLAGEFGDASDLRWPAGCLASEPDGPDRVEVTLAPAVVAGLDAIAAAAGQTRFVVLLAHWAAAMAEVTGQRDFAVGVPVSQREDPLLEQAVGCHITTVPLRLRGAVVDGDPLATGRLVARAFATQDVPLRDILGRLNRPRSVRPPLFQVMFAVQDNPVPHLDLAGARTTFLRQAYVDLPLELHTELWPRPDGGLRVEVAFRPDAVPAAVAAELASRFTDRLSGASS